MIHEVLIIRGHTSQVLAVRTDDEEPPATVRWDDTTFYRLGRTLVYVREAES